MCLPWGVSGPQTALALERLGIHTAIANRMPGVFAVQPGDDPVWLKRLPNKYIYRLPGEGRRWWFVTGWHHQVINRPSKSRYPVPPRKAPLPTAAGQDDPDLETPAETSRRMAGSTGWS